MLRFRLLKDMTSSHSSPLGDFSVYFADWTKIYDILLGQISYSGLSLLHEVRIT
jgi:hypothetical protein